MQTYASSTSNTLSSNDEYPASDAEKDLYYSKMRKLEVLLKGEQQKTKSLEDKIKEQQEKIRNNKKKFRSLMKMQNGFLKST